MTVFLRRGETNKLTKFPEPFNMQISIVVIQIRAVNPANTVAVFKQLPPRHSLSLLWRDCYFYPDSFHFPLFIALQIILPESLFSPQRTNYLHHHLPKQQGDYT